MKTADFAEFLVKLDRNKAPVSSRKKNTPVWEIISTSDTVRSYSETHFYLYIDSNYLGIPKWDGKYYWDGVALWQTIEGVEGMTFPYSFPYTFYTLGDDIVQFPYEFPFTFYA
jgi:hypothetical protein